MWGPYDFGNPGFSTGLGGRGCASHRENRKSRTGEIPTISLKQGIREFGEFRMDGVSSIYTNAISENREIATPTFGLCGLIKFATRKRNYMCGDSSLPMCEAWGVGAIDQRNQEIAGGGFYL